MIKLSDIGYIAEEGKTIIRKEDGADMGEGIILGIEDSIDNYEEADKVEEANNE